MTSRIVSLLRQRGVDAAGACVAAEVPLALVANPSARIDYASADRLLEVAAERLGAGGLAVALSTVFDDDTYDAAGLVLATAPTFREGMQRALRYQRLWGDGERFSMCDTAEGTWFRFEHPGPSPTARAICAELALLEVAAGARLLVTAAARPRSVHFRHLPFEDGGALHAALGIEPVFGSPHNQLFFPGDLVDSPVRVPETMLRTFAERRANHALDALPAEWSTARRVRALLEARAGSDAFALRVTEVAALLRMSPRTLQRALRRERTSFEEQVDDLRRERVALLLARGHSAKQAAYEVGFSDPGALLRARTRWNV